MRSLRGLGDAVPLAGFDESLVPSAWGADALAGVPGRECCCAANEDIVLGVMTFGGCTISTERVRTFGIEKERARLARDEKPDPMPDAADSGLLGPACAGEDSVDGEGEEGCLGGMGWPSALSHARLASSCLVSVKGSNSLRTS